MAQVTHVTVRNGLTLAYMVAVINCAMALAISFGIHLTDVQQGAIMAFVNAVVMLAARVLHLPEQTPDGGTVMVRHVPVLEASSKDGSQSSTTAAAPVTPNEAS